MTKGTQEVGAGRAMHKARRFTKALNKPKSTMSKRDWNKLTKALNTEDLALSKASVQVQKQLDRLKEEEKWLRKLLEHDAARLLDDDTVLTDKQPPPARDEHGGGDGGGAASASRARVGQEGAAEHPRPAPS